MYGSPEARSWPAWCCTQNSHAFRISETSSLGRLACTWRKSLSIRTSIISWVILGAAGELVACPLSSATPTSPPAPGTTPTFSGGEEDSMVAMLHYRPLLFDGHQIGPNSDH